MLLRFLYTKNMEMNILISIFMAQEEGFAPLAARPAPPLSMASFAVKLFATQSLLGKAFRSRETAPTLESLLIFVNKKYGNEYFSFPYLWRRKRDSNPRGLSPKRFSRPPRYDRFDIPAYVI